MEANGPIIFVDDDEDDQMILKPILNEIAPQSPVLFFTDAQQAIDYLSTTKDKPLIIISDVNLKGMSGLEFRRHIQQDEQLRRKSIPFIFFTSPIQQKMVEEAYELTIQGFFEKQASLDMIRDQLYAIKDYWTKCVHPNRFDD